MNPSPPVSPTERKMRFGALVYNNSENLGDEIQTLAAMRFMPRVDHLIDRDALGHFRAEDAEPVSVILNGWYGHRPESWPPSESIHPLLVSMHLSPQRGNSFSQISSNDFFVREPAVEYLRRHGPIGARDLDTLALLQKHDVPAYFSGCLTLTLRRNPERARTDAVVVNDVPDDVLLHTRRSTQRPLICTTHVDVHTPSGEERLRKARALLELYESAHCVVTTRLHCALPCLALGTPVLLIDMGQSASRFSGLSNLLRRCSREDYLADRSPVDLERPAHNPEEHRALGVALEEVAFAFAGGGARPQKAAASPMIESAELRFQTLLHVHADQMAKMNALVEEQRRLQAQLEAHRLEGEQLRGALEGERQRVTAEQQRLATEKEQWRTQWEARERSARATLAEKQRETERIEAALQEVLASATWRTALRLRSVARRTPAGLRGPLQKLKTFLE